MTNSIESKLSPHTTWLFAFGSIAAGIATSYALTGLGQKVTAAVYFGLVAIGGFLSTYLTRARVGGAILAFLTAGVVAAGGYYLLMSHLMGGATTAMADRVRLPSPRASGRCRRADGPYDGHLRRGDQFLETIVAGIGGAVAGWKSRSAGGLQALGAMAKSAR